MAVLAIDEKVLPRLTAEDLKDLGVGRVFGLGALPTDSDLAVSADSANFSQMTKFLKKFL